ncbi:MAG: Ig-like domain-containing protein [bacterium]
MKRFFKKNNNISFLFIGFLIGIFLCGFVTASLAKDGCGPSSPTSNGDKSKAGGDIVDRPDDTVDVSTYGGIMLHPSGYAPISILQNGYYGFSAALLEKLKEPYAVHDLSLPSDTLKDHPILIIPSGGLFGLEGSLLVKQRLAEYVYNGGTIICFTQQHGYEFSALPGGKLDGFGWREDQSCWRGGAYISMQHPIFAGQDTTYVDSNIDGYFTQWPDDSSILLRRTKNSMPTILIYPWGKGRVIATTFYSDQGFVMNHIAQDELNLTRDLIAWVKSPTETIIKFEKNLGAVGQLSLLIVNNSEYTAKKLKITVLNPDETMSETHNHLLTTSLSQGKSTTIDFQQAVPADLGIHHIDYILQDGSGNPIQDEIRGAVFSVYKRLDAPKITNDLTFAIQSDLETYPRGSDINFDFTIWNHTNATRTITLRGGFFFNPTKPEKTLVVPPKDKTTYVYTVHNVTQPRDKLTAHFYNENNQRIGTADRSFFTQQASIVMSLKTDKEDYSRGETVDYTLKIQNQTNITYNSTINLTVTSIGDGQIYKDTLELSIPAQGSITKIATFTLPYAMAGGVCIFDAQAYGKGEKIGQAITTFNTPKAIIIIDPILPSAFDYTSPVSFKITNVGALSLPQGTLAVTFKDSLNNLLWAGTETVGTLSLYGNTTLNFNIAIPQIKFEEVYKLTYSLINELTTLTGEIEIPCSNVIKLEFDKPSYRIREGLNAKLTITNTGKFKEDLLRIVSVPDCNFAGTDNTTLLPNETGSMTYNFTIPETTLAGLHSAETTLMLGTSTFTKSFKFFIPPAQIVFDRINKLTFATTGIGSFTLKNIGGVDEIYDYIVRIIDERNITIFEKTNTIEIRAGEVYSPIGFDIPNQALDGGYTLAILTTNSKGEKKNFYQPLYITGIKAAMNIEPAKKVYLPDEDVLLTTQITNLDGQIQDATLTVKAFSSIEEWQCYTEVNDICDIATDGNFIWFATPGGAKRYDKITDKFKTYTAIDGLAGNDVTTIAADSRFIWLGTRYNGLSRYDKINNTWQTFTKTDGLINNEVTSIAIGTDTVWVGSWDGAARYDKTQVNWKTYRIADTQPGNFINDIAIDDNLVWFATHDGIRRYDKRDNSWTGYTTQNGLAHNHVYSIGIDGNYIWFGSPDGLTTRYDKSNDLFNIFVTSVNQPENKVNAIASGTNSVWFASNKGITQYDKINHLWKTFTTQDGLAGNQTKAIGIDDDMVWAGGNDGINKYKPAAQWQTYTMINGLADNEVTAIDIDNEIIRFATVRGGLSQYDKINDSFKNLTTADGLSSNHVKAIAADADYVWLVTYDGISRYERIGGGFQNFRYDIDLLPYGGRGLEIHSSIIDAGYVWFAGYGGVLRFDKANSTFRRLTTNDGLIDTHINAIAKDDEYIYLGTSRGVSRYSRINQTWTNIPHLNNIVIYSIDTEDDAIWFGTEQGLYRYDKNKDTVRRFTTANSGLLKNDVRVVKTNGGFVWCATYDGVCRYDKANDTWQVYTAKDGLPSNFIRAIAIDSDYIYLATDHGVGRLQTKGRLLYQESKNISVTSPYATFTTNIGKVGIPGKSYIEANLISKLTQVIDTSSNSFYVISKDVYPVISTDKPVYKPQEPIIITATAYNCLSTSTSELSLILKKDEAIILSEAFILPPNGSITFTKTIKSDSSFVLAGFLNSEKTTEYIKVMPPGVSVIITVPEIVKRDEVDVSVQLKNVSELKVNIRPKIAWADIAEDLGTITLLPNQATFIQRKCRFTKSGTISVILSGDIEKVENKRVIFGERVTVEVKPRQLYPEGVVVIPFSLINTGKLDSELELEFRLQKLQSSTALSPKLSAPTLCRAIPKIRINCNEIVLKSSMKAPQLSPGDNLTVIAHSFYVPAGTVTTGEIIYDLEESGYILAYDCFFGQGSTSFKVAKNDVVDIEIDIAERVIGLAEQQLPINVRVLNLGSNEFKGDLSLDTGFYHKKVALSLSIGQTKTLTFIGTTSGSAGTYTILAEVLHNGKSILSESKTFELIPQFAFEEIPVGLSFTIDKKGTITLKVRNNGSGEGNVWVQLKIADIINETKPIWIKPKDFGSVSFSISIPDDLEDRDYSAYIILKTEKGEEILERIMPFQVSGIKIAVNAGLDKMLYSTGEMATFTISVSNLNPQVLPDMYAKIQSNGYESIATFTLTAATTTLIFRVPVSLDGRKLFYGIYMASGRSIYLNTSYIYQMKDVVNVYADKQVFKAGATITLTAVSLVQGTLTITDIEGTEKSYFTDGTTTVEFKLPEVLTSGTYRFSYTFIPIAAIKQSSSRIGYQGPPVEQLNNGNIQDEFKFDIIGYQAKVIESKLDKIEYYPGDRLNLRLKIDSNNPIDSVLCSWLVDPSWNVIPLMDKKATFTIGENLVELTGTISAAYHGVYKLVYALYMAGTQNQTTGQQAPLINADEKQLLLASGAETFDITILPKIISITPTIGRAGILVTIKGSGFGSNENIRIDFGTTITSGIATTDIVGSFTALFTTTQQSADGTITITAVGLSSGTSATMSLFVLDSTPPVTPTWGTITIKAGGEIFLEWNANNDLAGYRIYYGSSTGNYATVIDIKPPVSTYTLTLATNTTYYIALTAYDYVGNESGYSQERYVVPTPSVGISVASIVGGNRIATITTTGVFPDVVQVVFEVSLSNGTYTIGTDTTSPYEIYWNPSGINDGTVTVVATVIDLVGLKTAVSTTTRVDNTQPVFSVDYPAEWALVKGSGTSGSETVSIRFSGVDATTQVTGTPSVSIDGGTWTPASVWSAASGQGTYSVSMSDGEHTVRIRGTDTVGNVGYSREMHLRCDTTAPTLSITATPNPASGSVRICVAASEELSSTPIVGVIPNGTTAVTNVSMILQQGFSRQYTGTYTITSGQDGTVSVSATGTDRADNNGNVGTGSGSFVIDTTRPSGTLSINSEATYTTSLAVTLNLAYSGDVTALRYRNGAGEWTPWEGVSTVQEWLLSSGANGVRSVDMEMMDTSGNVGSTIDSIIYDATIPIGTVSINSGAVYATTTSVTLSLQYGEAGDVESVSFSNNGVTWTTISGTPSTYSNWTLEGSDGTKWVYFRINDASGLQATYADEITLDRQGPGCHILVNEDDLYTNDGSVTLTISAYDPVSGVGSMSLSNNGTAWSGWQAYRAGTISWSLINGAGSSSDSGHRYVHVRFMDNAGNISGTTSDRIMYDNIQPIATLTINENAIYAVSRQVRLNMESIDNASGVQYVRFGTDGTTFGAWEQATGMRMWMFAAEGTQTVCAQVRDMCGNTSSVASDTISIDTAAPIVSIILPHASSVVKSTVNVTFTIDQQVVGTPSIQIDGGAWIPVSQWSQSSLQGTYTWNTNGISDDSHIFSITAQDAAGNIGVSDARLVVVGNASTPATIVTPLPNAVITGNTLVKATSPDITTMVEFEVASADTTTTWSLSGAVSTRSVDTNGADGWMGTWTTVEFSDGTYTLKAYAYENSVEIGSDTISVTIDNTSPIGSVSIASPIRGVATAAYNSSELDIDRIVFEYGSGNGTDTMGVDTTAPFDMSWNTTNMTDGIYSVVATAIDHVGLSYSTSTQVVVDNTPPTGTITSPQIGSVIRGTVAVSSVWTDTHSMGTISMRIDSGTWTTLGDWDTGNWPDGAHSIKLSRSDSLSNIGYTDERIVIVDNTAPIGNVSANAYTNNGSVTLTLSYHDTTSQVVQVNYSDGGSVWTGWMLPAATHTMTIGGGVRTVYYCLQDTAGNVSTLSTTITYDGTLPRGTITINAGAIYTNTRVVSLSLEYSDDATGIDKVRYSNEPTFTGQAWEMANVVRQWELSANDGIKTVYYQVRDNAGNVYGTSDTIVLDTTACATLTVSSPVSGNTYRGSITLTAWAEDTSNTVYRVEFYVDGVLCTSSSGGNFHGTWATTAANDGAHGVYFRAIDAAGNGTNSQMLNIVVDNTAPESVMIVKPASLAHVTGTLSIEAIAADAINVARVNFYIDGTTTLMGSRTSAPWTMSINSDTMAEGSHTLYARCIDGAGNTLDSAGVLIETDNTVPTGTINVPSLIKGVEIITYNSSEQDIIQVVFEYSSTAGTYTIGVDSTQPFNISWNTTNMLDGTYTVRATAMDEVGLSYATNTQVVVDNTPLPLPIYITSVTHNATALLMVGDILVVTLIGSVGGTATFNIGTMSQGIVMKEIVSGSYTGTYTVRQGDNVINATITGYLTIDTTTISKDATRTVTIDTTSPMIAEHLKKVIVYPNPFMPNSTSGNTEIIFGGDKVPQEYRLTSQATIEIFHIAGELIKVIEETDGDGKATWDGRNDAGERVASGIYIYLITNPRGEKVMGKIGIIR